MRLALIGCVLALLACTENERARSFGGSARIELDAGQKLVNATWKEASLWILTRSMREGEQPEVYSLDESSAYGVWQGRIKIVERAR